jgi:hypothetical protein
MKSPKKSLISDDPRWKDYDDLRKAHEDIEATKLKDRILADHTWKKPCHHVADPSEKKK